MSIRKSWEINSQNLFLCAVRNNHVIFSFSVILEKKIVTKDDVENYSIKNNIISNPKGKLIFTLKVFTITNTKIMSTLALLRQCQLSPAASHRAPGVTSLGALASDSLYREGHLFKQWEMTYCVMRHQLLLLLSHSELADFLNKWNCYCYWKIKMVI